MFNCFMFVHCHGYNLLYKKRERENKNLEQSHWVTLLNYRLSETALSWMKINMQNTLNSQEIFKKFMPYHYSMSDFVVLSCVFPCETQVLLAWFQVASVGDTLVQPVPLQAAGWRPLLAELQPAVVTPIQCLIFPTLGGKRKDIYKLQFVKEDKVEKKISIKIKI